MADYQDNPNLFDTLQDISDAVSQATRTGDYSHLNKTIQDSVADFTDSIGESAQRGAQTIADAIRGGQRTRNRKQEYHSSDETRYTNSGTSDSRYQRDNQSQRNNQNSSRFDQNTATWKKEQDLRREKQARAWGRQQGHSYFLQTRPNRNTGFWKRVLSGAGTVIAGFYSLVNIVGIGMFAAEGSGALVAAFVILLAVTGGLTAFLGRMFYRTGLLRKLIDKYYQYAGIVGSNEYFYLDDIARRTGESRGQVADNLLTMQSERLLPDMALDQQKTTLMLTEQSYRQYEAAERARREREQASQQQSRQQGPSQSGQTAANQRSSASSSTSGTNSDSRQKEASPDLNPEAAQILDEGNAYIREIRQINDRIPDTEEMSDKLYRLEDIMKRIFAQVQKNPSKAKDIRKLMNYYLPTTTKLLNAYADLPDSSDSGQNIRETRRQIEESMDSINDAFEQLLDNLFQDEAWDLSSDLNVMKTMMKQDGLMSEDKGKKTE